MTEQEIKLFIEGLRIVIRTAWSTQKDFAEGVTSVVNMSNILRGSGTSQKMREALAAKAGMTIEEIVAIGSGRAVTDRSSLHPEKELPATRLNTKDMSSMDVMGQVADYVTDAQAAVAERTVWVSTICRELVEERDALKASLQQVTGILNSINDGIKVVNQDMVITYCNREYTKMTGKGLGTACKTENCACSSNNELSCLAEKVFDTGLDQQVVTSLDGKPFVVNGAPVYGADGSITHVLSVLRPAAPSIEIFKANGWTIEPPKN